MSVNPWEIAVNPKLCKKCTLCVKFCPKNVLEAADDGSPIIARPEDCIGCLLCEMHCPDFAITVGRREDK